METFCLPWHEIQERFTRSELVLMAWRSNEQSYQWKQKMKKAEDETPSSKTGAKRKQYDGIGPERMPDRFFAQEVIRDKRGKVIAYPGDFNLAQVPGEDARKYMGSLGIPFPDGVSKIGAEDPTTQQIREAYNIRR